MTNTTSTVLTTSSPAGGRLAADDPRAFFARAVDLAAHVIAGVAPDQFGHPTPCDEFDVRQLLRHLVFVLRRVAAVGRGLDAMSVPFELDPVPDEAGPWADLWQAADHDVQAVWSQPGILGQPMRLPWATLPGAVTMAIYTNEVTVHTWDLAKATGQRPAWDDTVVALALAAMQRGLPAEDRGPEVPFAPVVGIGQDAPLIDRLVAWNGRQP